MPSEFWERLVGMHLITHPYLAVRFSARWGKVILLGLGAALVYLFAPDAFASTGWLAALGLQAALGVASWRWFASPKVPPPSWERLGRLNALLDLAFFLYAFILTGGEPAFTPLLAPYIIRAAAEQPEARHYLAMCGVMLAGWLAALFISQGAAGTATPATFTRLSALVMVILALLTAHRLLSRITSALGHRIDLMAGVHEAVAGLHRGRPVADVLQDAMAVAVQAAGASRGLLLLASDEIMRPPMVTWGAPSPRLGTYLSLALRDPAAAGGLLAAPGALRHLTRFARTVTDRLPEEVAAEGGIEAIITGLGVPGDPLGVFCLLYDSARSRTEDPKDLARSAADHLALAVTQALSYVKARTQAARAEAAYRASSALIGVTDEEECARRVVEILRGILGYDHIAIFRVEDQILRIEAAVGYPDIPPTFPITRAVVGRVARTGQSAFVRRPEDDPDFVPVLPGVLSQIALPVRVEGGIATVLSVESRTRPLVEEDLRLLSTLAVQFGLAFENALLVNRIHETAIRDSLTGLFNYRQFWTDLPAEVERSRRYGERFSLLMVDIDGFKRINDTFGHPAGDEVLRLFARMATKGLRASDRVYRLGGDEFAVLLPATPGEGTVQAADRLRIGVRAEGISTGKGPRPTVSCGVASFPVDADQADRLVAAADQALYAAKVAGGDRVMRARGTTTRGRERA